MNTYTTPECPKCHSRDIFRTWNKTTRMDDGFCRICKKKYKDFDRFIMAGESSGKEFSKHDYYERANT